MNRIEWLLSLAVGFLSGFVFGARWWIGVVGYLLALMAYYGALVAYTATWRAIEGGYDWAFLGPLDGWECYGYRGLA